jgi:hypothetical protein
MTSFQRAIRECGDGTGYCRGCGTTIGEFHHNDCDLHEKIGVCEACGATDHHLVEGICPACKPKCRTIDTPAVINPAQVALILADEEIEYWGRYFVANRFDRRGVLFETFMMDPFAIAQALIFNLPMPVPEGEEFYPLLPDQRYVAMRFHPHVRAWSFPLSEDVPVFLRRQAD